MCREKDDHFLCSYSSSLFIKKNFTELCLPNRKNSVSICWCFQWFFKFLYSYAITLFFMNYKVYKLNKKLWISDYWFWYNIIFLLNYLYCKNTSKLKLCAAVYLVLIYYFIFFKICDRAFGLLCNITFWN